MPLATTNKRYATRLVAGTVGAALLVGLYSQVANSSQSPREQFCAVASNTKQFTADFRGDRDTPPGRFIGDIGRSLEAVRSSEFRDVGVHAAVLLDYVGAFEHRDQTAMTQNADAAREAQSSLNLVAEEECGIKDAF